MKLLVWVLAGIICWFSLIVSAAELPSIDGRSVASGDKSTSSVPASGGDFTLQSVNGNVSLSDLRGKIAIVFFGYTQCPDVCPLSMSVVVSALGDLDPLIQSDVAPVFITLDPGRDTPDVLAQYVKHYHSSMIGLSGTDEQIQQVARQYGIKFERVDLPDTALQYAINHSAAYFVVDKKGQLRFAFPHSYPAAMLAEAVRYLIDNP